MIGSFGAFTLSAWALGLYMARVEMREDEETYEGLRPLIQRELDALGVELEAPDHWSDYMDGAGAAYGTITERLQHERARMGGETAALPLFYVGIASTKLATKLALRMPAEDLAEVLDSSLDDLGIGADFRQNLERRVGLVVVSEVDGVDSVSTSDLMDAAMGFSREVLQQLVEQEWPEEEGPRSESESAELSEIKGLILGLQTEVRDFRAEFRAQTDRLAELIVEGDATTLQALGDIRNRLEAEGVDPETAEKITEADPASLWDQVIRWFGGAGPRDAAEAALWVALDFVPGGTGVKLGIKLAEAVRKSIKAGAR
jgi:hypothetical protein